MASPVRIALGGAPDVEPVSVTDLRVGFRAAYVIEVVEDGNPDAIDTHVFPINPQNYVLTEPFTSVLTPTEDGSVVAEENGLIIREIQLTGTHGFATKTAPTFLGVSGREVGGTTLSGNLHFQALRRLFRKYSELKKDPSRGPKIRMVFHSLKDDDHFVVVPRSFETPRDARTTRVHYTYRITLAVIDNSERRLRAPRDPFGLASVGRVISEAFNDARSFFAELTAGLSTLKRKIGNIQAVLINVGGFLNAVGNFVRGAGEVIKFGLQQANNIIDTLDRAGDQLADSIVDATLGTFGEGVRQIRQLTNSLQRITTFGDKFTNAVDERLERIRRDFAGEQGLTRDDLENGTAGASDGSATRVARGSTPANDEFPTPTGIRLYEIKRTDTIDSIAARFDVPPPIIIILNDLRFPYITDGGGPRVKQPGDELLIPVFETVRDDSDGGLLPSAEYLTPDEALYGRDLALDRTVLEDEDRFDVKVDTARGGFDAETITGLDNVVQGVRIIIETERGSTVYIPDLGIRRTVGISGTIRHVVLAALNLRTAVLQDPRIDEIQDSNVVLDGDVLQQEITPIVRGQRDQVTLILPIGSASGG